MRILIAGLLLATSLSAQAQSGIVAVYEETPRGLVRVDNQEYVHQPQPHKSAHDVEYHPGTVYHDFIYRPMYKMVTVYIPECKCERTVKVRVN